MSAMTILNIAVGERAVAIVTDGRLSRDGRPLDNRAQKCEALPLLSLLVAWSGDEGMSKVAAQFCAALRTGFRGSVLDVANWALHTLPALAERSGFIGRGHIVIAGVVDRDDQDRAYAFLLRAPTWAIEPLSLGTHLQPFTGPDGPTAGAEAHRAPSAPCTAPPPMKPCYEDSRQLAATAPDWQAEIHSATCGGVLLMSEVSAGGIARQYVLRDLEER